MTDMHGRFVWYELMTTDTAAAAAFYSKVVGWSAADAGMEDMEYTIFSASDGGIGGLMQLPQEALAAGGQPGWIGYVAADDIDARAAEFGEKGGTVHKEPTDIPGVGRFAIVADPQGAVLALFNGSSPSDDMRPPAASDAIGHAGWHELYAADWEKAFAFYSGLFGWEKLDAVDMGAMGTYQLFGKGGQAFGGMMTKTDSIPMPFWNYYFNVDGIEAAAGRVKDNSGQILHGPQQVPGGSWILQCLDPQGAMFALVSAK